ncbi:outer membrane beta-barrel protein [Ohtaekwangia sp.]|uniref:outer membrane beta-barrel protein n=1 Tax=Ohtaekwangia sp. TaxID=2066019 RepID=UPI002F95CADA
MRTLSFGVATGATTNFTLDEGISKDPRYRNKYDIKFAPVSIHYGVDYEGYGFTIDPGLVHVGQNFYVSNTSGGQQGVRKVNLHYANIPVAFKLHAIDIAFFRVSLVAGGSFAYLLSGSETVSHSQTRLTFPSQVYPILPSSYTVVYDGVESPEVSNYTMLSKQDFKSYQAFAMLGFRSDWQVNDEWMVSLDFRMNYGIFEPRTNSYLEKLNNYQTLYDLPGRRRDMFVQLNIGISRYLEFEKKEKAPRVQKARSPKKSSTKTKKYPYRAPRTSKPRG